MNSILHLMGKTKLLLYNNTKTNLLKQILVEKKFNLIAWKGFFQVKLNVCIFNVFFYIREH